MGFHCIRTRRRALHWIALFGLATGAPGMSESDAVLAGLTKNYDIQILRDGRELDSLDLAKLKAKWLPSIGLSGLHETRLTDSSRITTPIGVLGSSDEFRRNTAGLKIDQALPGGAQVSSTSSLVVTDHSDTSSTSYGVLQSASLNVPLLRNAWGNSSLEFSLKMNRYEKTVLTLQRKLQMLGLLTVIRSDFWQLVRQGYVLEQARSRESFFQKQLDFVRIRFKTGGVSEMDTLFQSLELSKANQAALEAGYGLRGLKRRFAYSIGSDTSMIVLEPGEDLAVPPLPPEAALWDSIRAWDPQLQAFEATHQRWQAESAHWKNALLPVLDAGLVQSLTRDGANITGAASAYQSNLTAQVRLSYDFPTSDRTLALRQTRVEDRKTEREKARQELTLRDSLSETIANFEVLKLTLANLEISRTIATRKLALSEQRFFRGELDALSLQKSRQDFDEISMALMEARIRLKLEQIFLESLDGTMLRKYGMGD